MNLVFPVEYDTQSELMLRLMKVIVKNYFVIYYLVWFKVVSFDKYKIFYQKLKADCFCAEVWVIDAFFHCTFAGKHL